MVEKKDIPSSITEEVLDALLSKLEQKPTFDEKVIVALRDLGKKGQLAKFTSVLDALRQSTE